MNPIKITLLTRSGYVDIIWLHFNIQEPIWPYSEITQARIEAATGKGLDWIEKNFPDCELEIIEG